MSQEPDQFVVMYYDGGEWKAALRTKSKEEALDTARRLKITDGIKVVSLQAGYRKTDGTGFEWQKVPFEITESRPPFVVQGLKPQWVDLGRAATKEEAERIAIGCQELGLDAVRVWDEQTNSASCILQDIPPQKPSSAPAQAARPPSRSSGGNMLVKMQNDHTRDIKILKIGFDWPAFFSPLILGIPHFLRGMHMTGGALLVACLLFEIVPPFISFSQEEVAGWHIIGWLVELGLAIFFGIKGREQFAKRLLENGYDFSDPESESVSMAKASWGIV